jgi:hypothetical protein
MADPPSIATSLGTPFAPCALVPVNIGRSTINLYPVINPSMQSHKCAHAFHTNKMALSSQTTNLQIQLDALGHQVNLSATVDKVIHNWVCHYNNRWFNFSQLVILSFHDKKGNHVNNTMIAGNLSVLLPVVDGAIAYCHHHIKFMRLQLSVNFIDLVTVNHPGPTTLWTEYNIKLPQTMHAMTMGTWPTISQRSMVPRNFVLCPSKISRWRYLTIHSRRGPLNFSQPALVLRVPKQTPLLFTLRSRAKSCACLTSPSVTLCSSSYALATATSPCGFGSHPPGAHRLQWR